MKQLIFLFSAALIVSFTSCTKSDVSDYNGKWELITKPIQEIDYFWEMTDGHIDIYTVNSVANIDTCTTGDYLVKNSVITIAAPIRYCTSSTYDGEWDVHKHTDKFLILIRYLPRGTIYLEFIKR